MACLGQKRLAVFSLILALATAQPDVAPILIESGMISFLMRICRSEVTYLVFLSLI
jgi:hypothetical protein